MDIRITKLELIEWIAQMSDINVISRMDKIRRAYQAVSKDEVKPMTFEEFYASIEKAEDDIKSGRIYTQEEVEKESENW